MMWYLFVGCILLFACGQIEYREVCGRGWYRATNGNCILCPRGTYSNTTEASSCTKCASGRYRDTLGGETDDDCKLCPVSRYGQSTGLKTSLCTAACPKGKYSTTEGLINPSGCDVCPIGYFSNNCNFVNSVK